MPAIAFVLGPARSGTTAMAGLLNAHGRVCIGIERYKYLVNQKHPLDPSLFEEDRFFAFDPAETNILPRIDPWAATYAAMRPKWATALVVGDKLGARALPGVLRDIPSARVIYMLRGIEGVASSWNVRALRARDRWPRENDFSVAVPKWNQLNRMAMRALDSLGPRMLVVEYERFFSGDETQARALEAFLGVPHDAGMLAAYRRAAEYYVRTVAAKAPTVLEGQEALIAAEADKETYAALVGHARRQIGGAQP